MKTKHCSTCGKDKPLKDFEKHKSTKDGYRYLCRECKKEKNKKYRNPQKQKVYDFNRKLKEVYNITQNDYDKMFNHQNRKCKICGSEEPLVIDHNHKTGKVRGLICHKCNVGLGMFRDSKNHLSNAISYLK